MVMSVIRVKSHETVVVECPNVSRKMNIDNNITIDVICWVKAPVARMMSVS